MDFSYKNKIKLILLLVIFISTGASTMEYMVVKGNNNPSTPIQIAVDISRFCSHLGNNLPNHSFTVSENIINLKISIDWSGDADRLFGVCDPVPPPVGDSEFDYFTFESLNSGPYEVHLFLVTGSVNVNDGKAMGLPVAYELLYFQIATPILF